MRSRDIGILFVCATTVLMSFQQNDGDGFRIRRAWKHSIDRNLYTNGQNPLPHEKIPPPVIADLDGDGINEVVLLTKEPSIRILNASALQYRTTRRGAFQDAHAAHEQQLLSHIVRLTAGRQPACMAVGFVDPPLLPGELDKNGKPKRREQVIVVVTQDWSVMCFDARLKLMWQTSLQDFTPGDFFHREVAITITPVGVFKGDRGMILVAGSSDHELTVVAGHESLAGKMKKKKADEAKKAAQAGADKADDNPQDDLLVEQDIHHFSYYALEGGRGGLRWSHEAGDFETSVLDDENNLSPQHNYKLDVRGNDQHQDEVDWRQYRDSVLRSMPHAWRRRDDTALELAHFAKQRRARGAAAKSAHPSNSAAAPSLLEHAAAAAHVITQPVAGQGRVYGPPDPPPNVIVAHRAEGIDIVHMFSGRVLCQLRMSRGSHIDVNGDGRIDHVYSLAGHDLVSRAAHDRVAAEYAAQHHSSGPRPGCMAVATSGIPVHEQLFNASLCHQHRDKVRMQGTFDDVSNKLDAVDPVFLRSTNKHSDITKFDSVFLLSNGRVTCVGPDGEQKWQVSTSATWMKEHVVNTKTTKMAEAHHTDSTTVTTLLAMASDSTDEQALELLAVGQSNVVLISSDGRVRATMHMGAVPVNNPSIGDFNNDGVVDVIMSCADGYYGYAVERRPNVGGALFSALVAILLVILATVWVMNSLDDADGDAKKDLRSTDDADDYGYEY